MSNNGQFDLPDVTRLPNQPRAVLTDPNHPVRANSRLERVLRSGRFAVTSEIHAPDSADPEELYTNALVLSEVCDAINATDGSGAHCHMSSLACSSLMLRAGYEPNTLE